MDGFLGEFFVAVIPVAVLLLLIIVKVLQAASAKTGGASGTSQRAQPSARGGARRETGRYDREVHDVHKRDRDSDYARRNDQLRNLYESGMMERPEYMERKAALDDDYRSGRQL